MSGLEWWHLLLSGSEGPDFRDGGRMSGGSGEAGCPGCRGRMFGACSFWRLCCCSGRRSKGRMFGVMAGCPGPGSCS